MDRGAWQTAVHEFTMVTYVTHTHTHTHIHIHTHMHIANKLFALEDLSQNLLIGKPNLRQLGLLRKEEVHVGCDEPARRQLLQKCSEV